MKKTIILIVLSHVLAFACMGQSSNERILKELDEVIGKKKRTLRRTGKNDSPTEATPCQRIR